MRPMPSSNASVVRLHSPSGLEWPRSGYLLWGWAGCSGAGLDRERVGIASRSRVGAVFRWEPCWGGSAGHGSMGQDIRTSSMPLAIMMTWVALLSTMMGWVLSLFTSGNGQQANRRSAIALVHVFGLRFGTMFSLTHLRSRVTGALVSASWLYWGFRFGDEGQMRTANLSGDF